MKKIIIQIFILSFFLNCYSFDKTETFVDEKYNYSFEHPNNWNSRIYRSGIVLSEANAKDGKSGFQVRKINSKEETKDFIDNYSKKFAKDLNAKCTGKTSVKIDEIPSYKISFEANRGGTDYLLLSFIIPVKDSYFVFQAGTPLNSAYNTELIIIEIAESFKITK